MLLYIVFGRLHAGLAALAHRLLVGVQAFAGTHEAGLDLLAQPLGLIANQAGRLLQQLLGVLNQCLEICQQRIHGRGLVGHGRLSSGE
ncbi:hypothetical protein D3C72_2311260 [compost metagenome]